MDISWWQAAVLGVVEGLSEFLPISSTGHLIVAEPLIKAEDSHGVFTVVIQLGAILAVCVYFRKKLWDLARGAVSRDPAALRFISLVAVATIPALIGLLLNKWIEEHLFSPAMVACSFVWGGLAILLIERRRAEPVYGDAAALPWLTAIGIGFCQLLAGVVPGLSRSGATILGALCLGVSRPAATEFSFFMAMPVLLGASVLKLAKHHHELTTDNYEAIAVGFSVSFVVALAVVHWLLRYVAKHDFRPFAWYRIVAGVVLAILISCGFFAAVKGG